MEMTVGVLGFIFKDWVNILYFVIIILIKSSYTSYNTIIITGKMCQNMNVYISCLKIFAVQTYKFSEH